MVLEIKVGDGVWFIPDDVAEALITDPPAPNTLFGKPVVQNDKEDELAFQKYLSAYYGRIRSQ